MDKGEVTSAQTKNSGKFQSVQAARGIAALLVAFFHGQHVVKLSRSDGAVPFGGFFGFGHAGVDFFFVLSGFIIFYVHRFDLNTPLKLPVFFWKRIVRIYPLFLFLMLFVTAKFVIKGDFDWTHFLKTIFLIPQPPYPMLIQSWTLVHEAFFYLFFGLAIFRARLGLIALGLWLAVFTYLTWVKPSFGSGFVADFISVVASPYNLLFLIGIAVAWFVKRGPIPFARTLAAVGAIGFIAVGVADNNHMFEQFTFARICLFGISSGVMLTGLVAAEATGLIRVGRFGDFLGDLSYPLYLVHGAVISVAISGITKVNNTSPGWLLLLLSILAACVAAFLINRFVEKPIALYLRNVWIRGLSKKFV